MLFSDLRVKDVHAILHYTPRSMRFVTKKRSCHIIGLQCSGKAVHVFKDRKFTLEKNCLYFFNQAEEYRVEVLEKGLCFSVHFTTFLPVDVKSFCLPLKDDTALLQVLESIEASYLNEESEARMLSEMYRLFDEVERMKKKRYAPKNERLVQARDYIYLHFKEKDCVNVAAEKYGVTRRRFLDLFKNEFHITPNQYVLDHKIRLAKRLLSTPELSVGEVGALCGFEDIYYFSKCFRTVTGLSPSAFRQTIQEKR